MARFLGRARRSRDGLMESCSCHHRCRAGHPPPPAGWSPKPSIILSRDGRGRSAFTLTKRTYFLKELKDFLFFRAHSCCWSRVTHVSYGDLFNKLGIEHFKKLQERMHPFDNKNHERTSLPHVQIGIIPWDSCFCQFIVAHRDSVRLFWLTSALRDEKFCFSDYNGAKFQHPTTSRGSSGRPSLSVRNSRVMKSGPFSLENLPKLLLTHAATFLLGAAL